MAFLMAEVHLHQIRNRIKREPANSFELSAMLSRQHVDVQMASRALPAPLTKSSRAKLESSFSNKTSTVVSENGAAGCRIANE